MRRRPPPITQDPVEKALSEFSEEKRWADFLEYLSESGIVTDSAARAGLNRAQIKRRIKTDHEFRALYEEAMELGIDAIEDEATRRATIGTLEPVFHKGRRVATIRKKSDLLMIFMLKARRPQTFKDNYSPPEQEHDATDYTAREQIARRIDSLAARIGTAKDPKLIDG